MTDYNEQINEFAPATPDVVAEDTPIEPVSQPGRDDGQMEDPAQPEQVETPNAYQSIIEQQTEQINALIAQNESLTSQITQLIKNGAQISNSAPQKASFDPLSNFNGASLADGDDYSLESLAKDIGKHNRH